jgi:hypothetical protein
MSQQPIEGKVVATRYGNNPPAAPGPSSSGGPRTEYVYLQDNDQGGDGSEGQQKRTYGLSYIRNEPRKVGTPKWAPSFLGHRTVLGTTWLISMVVVGVDDWHNNGVLPRPSRLWYTSLAFGLMALASIVEALVPIINLIAIGFTLMLIWQYFNKTGQFAPATGS